MAETQNYMQAILSREQHFRDALGTQRDFGSWWAQTKAWLARQIREIDYSRVALVDIIGAYTDAAKNGLMIDGEECMVMIRGQRDAKIRCEIGAKGVIRKAGQAGITVNSRTICEGDEYDFDEAEGWIKHKRALKGRGEAIAYYAVATYRDGRKVVRILDREQAEKRATKSGAWKTWFDEMGEKSAVLTLRKVLYFGDELENMLAGVSTWAGAEPEAEDVGGPGMPGDTVSDKVAAAAARRQQDADAEGPVHDPDEDAGEADEDGQEPQKDAAREPSPPDDPKPRSQGRSRRQNPREEEPPPPSDDDCPI